MYSTAIPQPPFVNGNDPRMYMRNSAVLANQFNSPTQERPHNLGSIPPSVPGSAANSVTSSVPTKGTPIQKRRRVTRACDECRRKKIKCDGKNPCTHCTVYSYECTYDQPSNRRRNPAPQYVEGIEHRLSRTMIFFKTLFPDVNVDAEDFDPVELIPRIQQGQARIANSSAENNSTQQGARNEESLEPMVQAAGRLEIDEMGHMDFHGHTSGVTYLNHLNTEFGSLIGDAKASIPPTPQKVESPMSIQSPNENLPDTSLLPPKDVAKILVETCLNSACVLMRFIHVPSFMKLMNSIYDNNSENYNDEENRFLPLLYETLAVGCLFVDNIKQFGFDDAQAQATKLFNAGRRMIEMTDIRDMESIQAVLLMVMFLQASSGMQTCYSYVEIALSAAVRMGLHRALPEQRFNPIEREVRKRVFWNCWKMDMYVSALLGLPRGIDLEDVDCPLPAEIDDEYITRESIQPQPEGEVSMITPVLAHTRLLQIMAKTVRYIYPVKGVEFNVVAGSTYTVNLVRLHEIEKDLVKWLDELPSALKPGPDCPPKFLRSCFLLRISFAHLQMMLYRPFVHYTIRNDVKGVPREVGKLCVKVSRKVIGITDEMRKAGMLNGAYWFTIYTTFFSIITLVYYVLSVRIENDQLRQELFEEAKAGKDNIASLQELSVAAKRCSAVLEPMFEKIPEKLRQIQEEQASRKRPRTEDDIGDEERDDVKRKMSPPEQPLNYQAHFATGGPAFADQNSIFFAPETDYGPYQIQTGPYVTTPTSSNRELQSESPTMYTPNGSNVFGNLEGNIFGPLPPYLLQGQGQLPMQDASQYPMSSSNQGYANGSVTATAGPPSPMGQFLMAMPGCGQDTMLGAFFGAEWDDMLAQQQQPQQHR